MGTAQSVLRNQQQQHYGDLDWGPKFKAGLKVRALLGLSASWWATQSEPLHQQHS